MWQPFQRFPRRIAAVLALSGVLSPMVQAKKLYKFQDAQGRWHYTDAKPEDGQAKHVEVRQMAVEPALAVMLEYRDEGVGRRLLASNRLAGPVEVEVRPDEVVNMAVEPPLPHRFVLAAGSLAQPIAALRPENPALPGTVRYSYSYTPGDPAAVPQEGFAYLPPIPVGGSYTVSQGFGGAFSHQGAENRYAVDIAMAEHTPVHAARGGVVMAVENDFYEGGVKEKLQSRANHIRILHDDGSMAVYAHLALESTQVAPGQRVSAGQHIGYSGSTGYASGPHLHLVIQRNAGMRLEAVPFRFLSSDGDLRVPKEGDVLWGVAGGGSGSGSAGVGTLPSQ